IDWSDSTYNGNPHPATAQANGISGENGLSPSPSLTYYAGESATGTALAGAPTNAGTYTVKAVFAGNGNYDGSADTKTITTANAALPILIDWSGSTYNGNPHPATAQANGISGEN